MKLHHYKFFLVSVIICLFAAIIFVTTLIRLGFFNEPALVSNQNFQEKIRKEVEIVKPDSHPEISINEYWDFAKLPNRRIYINNTDRNVVYILDDKGKIVNTIWGKDYGLKYFEPRLVQEKNTRPLLLLRKNEDKVGRVVVVDPISGKVLWHTVFDGYFDGPQMQVLSGGTWIMESYGGSKQGVHVRGVNSETGAIKWEIVEPNYFGQYWNNYKMPPGQYSTNSGGVGRGNWKFHYVVQVEANSSTPAGTVLSRDIFINTSKETSANLKLKWNIDQKQISLSGLVDDTQWSVKPGDKLYDIVASRSYGAAEIIVYPTTILVEYYDEKKGLRVWDVFSTEDGSFLWHKEFVENDYFVYSTSELVGVLITIQIKKTSCDNVCAQDVCSGFICIAQPVKAECQQCHTQEVSEPGYIGARLQAFYSLSGNQMWMYGAKSFFLRRFNTAENIIEILENEELVVLNPLTGEKLPITE